MSIKFNYESYTITTDFKSDYTLSMTASDNYSGDYYLNQSIELTKIKKDTVIATLSHKNQEHLKCQFSVVDSDPRKLIIEFVVSYDFLPTFKEYITLDQLSNKKGINKVQTAELKSDIDQLSKLISSASTNLGIIISEEQNHTFTVKTELFSKKLSRGTYLVQLSSFYVNPTGGTQKNDLIFHFDIEKQTSTIEFCSYTNGGYGCPVSLKKQLVVVLEGQFKINAELKNGVSSTLNNTIITISPILKLR